MKMQMMLIRTNNRKEVRTDMKLKNIKNRIKKFQRNDESSTIITKPMRQVVSSVSSRTMTIEHDENTSTPTKSWGCNRAD